MYHLERIRIGILSCDMLFGITGRQTAQETDLADRSRDKISHLQNFYSNSILVGEKKHTQEDHWTEEQKTDALN